MTTVLAALLAELNSPIDNDPRHRLDTRMRREGGRGTRERIPETWGVANKMSASRERTRGHLGQAMTLVATMAVALVVESTLAEEEVVARVVVAIGRMVVGQ
ncbi:hypothetical protein GGH91_002110 [Coemansia sp. RSA 2671]|nr:hypothetical protein GGH91_002110 [Coemansia sp. RSA 2671]